MFGIFLLPMLQPLARPKVLEIGMGCSEKMGRSHGMSAKLWFRLLPKIELWQADVNGSCVRSWQASGRLRGINALVGDQGNRSVLRDWARRSGGDFDAIIDDGGHKTSQLLTSFDMLWPTLRPGGLYFLTDLGVGRYTPFEDSRGKAPVSDVLQGWADTLLVDQAPTWLGYRAPTQREARARRRDHPAMPPDVAFIFTQRGGVVIGKSRFEGAVDRAQGKATVF